MDGLQKCGAAAQNDYSRALTQCQARKRILCVIILVKEAPRSGGKPSYSLDTFRCMAVLFACRTSAPHEVHHRGDARTTRATPLAVSSMPSSIETVKASPNKAQAITAVQGGTRYIRLVTDVAAPRWIRR